MPPVRRLLAFGFFLVLAGCQSKPATQAVPHSPLRGDFEPLREAFNADRGKVRVMMLLAPA